MKDAGAAAKAIVEVCRRMYDRGYVVATEGNVSVRLVSGDLLVTGTRVRKRGISVRDLVRLTPAGVRVSGSSRPSGEAALHRLIYAKRDDVNAVVHAHPPCCTAFALARTPLPAGAIPEVLVEFGAIPLVPFAAPSTGKLARAIEPFVMTSDFFLLANHGVVACAADLEEAYDLVERAEHAARTLLLAGLLGGGKNIPARDRAELLRIHNTRRGGQSYGRKKT
jgi:L-fuculose-phosphate aldolase